MTIFIQNQNGDSIEKFDNLGVVNKKNPYQFLERVCDNELPFQISDQIEQGYEGIIVFDEYSGRIAAKYHTYEYAIHVFENIVCRAIANYKGQAPLIIKLPKAPKTAKQEREELAKWKKK